MPPFDALLAARFDLIKGVAFGVLFMFAIAAQAINPHQNSRWTNFLNLKNNIVLGLVNNLLLAFICGSCLSVVAMKANRAGVGLFHLGVPVALQVLLTIGLLDLVAYAFHRLYHRVPLFWRLHRVHHSDAVVETSTAVRFHPGEILISVAGRLTMIAILGIPLAGLLTYEILFIAFNLFEHSDLTLPDKLDRIASRLFITPSMHRLHHSTSQDDYNSNFGTVFSCWDHLFRTLGYRHAKALVTVGLARYEAPKRWVDLLTMPFKR